MATYEDAKAISDFLRSKIKDKIEISDFGATIIPKDKKLSNGCYACKSGSWICIYIGVNCNLKCVSCPQISRHDIPEFIWANGGADDIHSIEDLDRVLNKNKRITGISFSGGEPFLYLDKVIDWLQYINKNFSELNLYKWIYTNGTRVTKKDCLLLRENGINEIRFDLASTNYDDKIINKLKYCKNIFDKITVEVPVESWKIDKLISVLPKLNEIGLDYLNLHELALCDDNYSRLVDGGFVDVRMIYDSRNGLHDLASIIDTYKIINYIEDNNLNIIYNDCSCRNMINQTLGWYYQRNRQNPDYIWESWEDFLIRAEKDGNTP
ncbi:radical SAM protein [Candidatus Dojkabacteria bacterium]|jgi:pyruvate formate-lyase activating enzyme-like uncharacterized protein|nr:radical SAM protein [Candidatus Dojkabacteria bacterium]